jgi:hypothetical protein
MLGIGFDYFLMLDRDGMGAAWAPGTGLLDECP